MRFIYKAKKGTETIEGAIEAESATQAVNKIEEMGCIPMTVSPEAVRGRGPVSLPRMERISSKEINTFTRQLSSMVRSKVLLVKALDILARETQNARFAKVIREMADEVKRGRQLSEALAKYPQHFSRIYVNMVASAEKGGMLDTMLLRLVEFADWEEEIKSKIQSALAYPVLMLIMGALSIFVMITFVMPKMIKLFIDIGQDLPLPTRILMAVSQAAAATWYWVLPGLAVLGLVIVRTKVLERNRAVLDQALLKVPVLGRTVLHKSIAQFCRTLSLLMEHGIHIREAFTIAIPTLGNRALETQMGSVASDLSMGMTVSGALSKVPFFPGFVLSLIKVGEESGQLHEALKEIANSYEREFNTQIKILSALIEPLLILAIGLVVGFIVMAMLLPIFEISFQ